jgi:hypothetical protein
MAGLNNFMFTGKITNRRDMAKKIDVPGAASLPQGINYPTKRIGNYIISWKAGFLT